MRNIKTSLIILFAIMLANVVSAQEVVTVQLCDPTAKFLFGCQTFDQTGVYPNIEVGGVSKTLDLRIGQPSEPVLIEDTIAVGETYLFACQTLTSDVEADLEAEETYTNASGCDSVVVLHLALREPVPPCEPVAVELKDTIYVGETYLFGCQTLSSDAAADLEAQEIYQKADGCDSTVTLYLRVEEAIIPCEPVAVELKDTIYVGDTYLFGCQTLSSDAVADLEAQEIYQKADGCDSTVTLYLRVEEAISPCEPVAVELKDTI